MKKAIIIATLLLLAATRPAIAITPTPTAITTLIPTDAPIASAESIIKKTKDEILRTALDKNLKNIQGVLGDNVNRNLLVGYAGTISDIKQGVFSLNTDEAPLQVSYNSASTILKDTKPLKPEFISLKDKAIVIGNLTSPDILTAKRIVISTKNDTPKFEKKVIYSPVVKTKGNTLTLKIDNQNQDVTLGKKLKLDLKSITPNSKIFGIILVGTDSTITLIQAKVF